MGIFGPDTRLMDGEVFILQAEFPDKNTAAVWQKEYQAYGFKARIIPNAQKQAFEVWVSEHPSMATQSPSV